MAEEFDDPDFLGASINTERTSTPQPGSVQPLGGSKVVQPKPQALPGRQGPTAILVSTRQKGNPILNHVKSLPWEYSDIPCDYVVGATTCVLFLSLKYHRLHPEYIYSRLRQLGKLYNLRILLTMIDITNHEEALKELSKTSMINNLTLVLCWSAQEAGRYLELFKSYEHASPASIRAHQAETYKESLTEFVTTPRNINKTDAASLISNFGSLRTAVNAHPEEIAMVPGWGEKKVKAWCTTVREPFRVKRAAKASMSMVRHETTGSETDIGGDLTPHRAKSPFTPIPISTVPSLVRQPTTKIVISREDSIVEKAIKRPRTEERELEDFDDDAEAELLTAGDQDRRTPSNGVPKTAQAPPRRELKLSDGVMAALAKLRQDE